MTTSSFKKMEDNISIEVKICKSCDKSFSTEQNLRRHIYTVHDGNKDYKCEACGKMFSLKHQLKNHIHVKHQDKYSELWSKYYKSEKKGRKNKKSMDQDDDGIL